MNWPLVTTVTIGSLVIIAFLVMLISEIFAPQVISCIIGAVLFSLILAPLNLVDYGFTGSGMPNGVVFKILSDPIPVPEGKDEDKNVKNVVVVLQYPEKNLMIGKISSNEIATFVVPEEAIIYHEDCPEEKKGTVVAVKTEGKNQYLLCLSENKDTIREVIGIPSNHRDVQIDPK